MKYLGVFATWNVLFWKILVPVFLGLLSPKTKKGKKEGKEGKGKEERKG